MPGDEAAVAAQRLNITVRPDRAVGELATADARVSEKRACAAVDIDRRVGAGGSGAVAQGVQLAGVVQEKFADGAQDRGAVVKGERSKGRAADGARTLVCGCQVEAAGTDNTDCFAGDRIGDMPVTRARVPATCDVALERAHNRPLQWSI